MQLTEDAIIDEFITWADDNITGDMAEQLEQADEAEASFTSADRGFIVVDGEVFCSWCASAKGVQFKL